VKVKIASIPGSLAAGGGESIALGSVGSDSSWLSGESGIGNLDFRDLQMVRGKVAPHNVQNRAIPL
jgi:hypothetical protein